MNASMITSATPVAAVCVAASRAAEYASAGTWFSVDIRTTRLDHLKVRGPGGTS